MLISTLSVRQRIFGKIKTVTNIIIKRKPDIIRPVGMPLLKGGGKLVRWDGMGK